MATNDAQHPDHQHQQHQHQPDPPPPPAPLPIQQAWAELEQELAVDASRRAALVQAVVSGDLPTVQAMVAADHALAFHTLNRKTTLLVLAVEHGHLHVSQFLLERGVDVNKASQMRLSPLHAAARLPDGRPLIRLLVRHGARLGRAAGDAAPGGPNHQGRGSGRVGGGCYGWHSPLHEAAIKKRADNARLLAELGADPAGRDGHGMTPLDYCGAGSAVGKAIREGVGVKEVRDAVRRLFFVSVVEVATAPGVVDCPSSSSSSLASSSLSLGQQWGDGEEEGGAAGGGGKRRRKGALSWRDARRQRGRPLPAVAFVCDAEEEGGGPSGSSSKRAAALRDTGRLLRGVFVHMPVDVRRQIVRFV